MADIWLPETFRQRPYASEHFPRIVEWASREHALYRERLSEPCRHVPLLDRRTALENNDLLLNGHEVTGHTSGTTGFPVRISWSSLKARRNLQAQLRFREWMGGPLPRARLASPTPGEYQPDLIDVCEPLAKQVEFILSRRAEAGIRALVTYPSNAVHLADYVRREGLDMSFIERIVCFSEAIDAGMREAIQAGFPRARIWSTYSSKEVGTIATQCPFNADYHHINGLDLGVEVLDDEDRPCRPGEPGRLVVTDYFNTHSTFIRYDIGDLVVPGECPCGRINLPALQAVLGKTRGSLKKQDGEPIMFSNIADNLRMIEGLLQYQVIQDELHRLRFRYVPAERANPGEIERLAEQAIYDFLEFRPSVQFVRETEIEKEPSGKFMASICHV